MADERAPATADLKAFGGQLLAELHSQVTQSRLGELAVVLMVGGDFQTNRLLDLARLLLPEAALTAHAKGGAK